MLNLLFRSIQQRISTERLTSFRVQEAMKKYSWLFEQAGQLNYRNEEAYLYNYIEIRLSNLFFKVLAEGS